MPCLCADLEVLYWKEQKLRMAAQRKLQSWPVSGHSTGQGWGELGSLGALPALAGGDTYGRGAPGLVPCTPPACPGGPWGPLWGVHGCYLPGAAVPTAA